MKHLLEQVHSSEPVPIMASLPRPLEIVPESRPRQRVPLEVGDPAPSGELIDFMERRVTIDDLKGKRRLVLFWNSTCGLCRRLEE
jgi:hypothetical protein